MDIEVCTSSFSYFREETVSKMLNNMFELEQNESVIVNGLFVIHTLLEVRRQGWAEISCMPNECSLKILFLCWHWTEEWYIIELIRNKSCCVLSLLVFLFCFLVSHGDWLTQEEGDILAQIQLP